jgi:hypothetical protein
VLPNVVLLVDLSASIPPAPLQRLDDIPIGHHDLAIGRKRLEESRKVGPDLGLLEMLTNAVGMDINLIDRKHHIAGGAFRGVSRVHQLI